MSHWQTLIVAAQAVCDAEQDRSTPGSGLRLTIARLRTALAGVRRQGDTLTFTTFSGVSLQRGGGFVEFSGPALPTTMAAAQARALGLSLLEAAAAAEHDAIVVAEMQAIGLPMEQIGGLLQALRARRHGPVDGLDPRD